MTKSEVVPKPKQKLQCSSVSDAGGDPELPARGPTLEFMYQHVGIFASFGLSRPSSAGVHGG
jgi:hypothetical protein